MERRRNEYERRDREKRKGRREGFHRNHLRVSEDREKKRLFQVSTFTHDDTCNGGIPRVKYLLRHSQFFVDEKSGQLCVKKQLDYEEQTNYHLSINVTGEGLGTHGEELKVHFIVDGTKGDVCVVSIQVEDVNDNSPLFSPQQYRVTMKEGEVTIGKEILLLSATDRDHEHYGEV